MMDLSIFKTSLFSCFPTQTDVDHCWKFHTGVSSVDHSSIATASAFGVYDSLPSRPRWRAPSGDQISKQQQQQQQQQQRQQNHDGEKTDRGVVVEPAIFCLQHLFSVL